MATYQTFCRGLPRAMARELGAGAPPHTSATGWMVKLWFGNKDLHYECGVYHSRRVVELGLHFESDALTNQLLLGALRGHAKAIARKLPAARIEAWDKGWARVWEPIALERFDEPYSARLTKTFARYVRVLEPILEDSLPADVRWSQSPRPRSARRRSAMPTTHEATATWRGDLAGGRGGVSTRSGTIRGAGTSWKERTEGTGTDGLTSPEELLAAAHASCFTMAFAARLAKAGIAEPNISVTAKVTFGPKASGGNGVLSSALTARAQAPNGDAAKLKELAEDAKENCPISQALKGNVALSVEATPS